jgi:hypothetical protein
MPRTIRLPLSSSADARSLLDKARVAGAARGVRFSGDERSGRFEGTAEGTYEVSGAEVVIVVDRKPMILPWGAIEKALRDLFRP